MKASGTTQAALAARLQINQSSVSSWLRKVSRPEHHHRLALELVSNIESDAWLTDKERAAIDGARARTTTTDPPEPVQGAA